MFRDKNFTFYNNLDSVILKLDILLKCHVNNQKMCKIFKLKYYKTNRIGKYKGLVPTELCVLIMYELNLFCILYTEIYFKRSIKLNSLDVKMIDA